MYNPITTEDFDKWITAESRTFEVKCDVVDGADTVTMSGTGQSGDIISMEWNNVICSNDGLQIGTCCMDEFRMTYRNKDSLPSLMDKEIHPYVGLVCPHENTGDVTVWIPLGVFYVTNTETEDEEKTFTLTAYDGMQRFMGDFDATAIGVTFPINAWSLLTAIASHFGMTIEYDEQLFLLLSSDNYMIVTSDDKYVLVHSEIDGNKNVSVAQPLEGTYRDYIGWIAGLVGANAHMGRTGRLRIARYTDYGLRIPRTIQHMGGTKINFGGSVSYTNIVSGTDENPVYSTSYSGNAITYTNPFITVTELDKVCDELIGEDGITVTPCDIAWRSDPRVDAGDIVQAEDKDGNYFPVYVMERVVRITGGLAEDLHCYAETEVAHTLNKSPLVTSFNNKINKAMKTASDYINNTKGTFEWIDNGDGTNGGFTIYEADDTSSWLRCTAGGIGISADGGLTYANAITKNGVTATQIDIKENGLPVFYAGYDEENDGISISAYYPSFNTKEFEITSGKWAYQGSPQEGSWLARVVLRDPEQDEDRITLESFKVLLQDDQDYSYMSQFFVVSGVDDEGKTSRIRGYAGMSYLNHAKNSYASLGVSAEGAGSIFLYANTLGYPSLQVNDPSLASPVHMLKLMPITINGTQYYMFASTN